jgi:hypothetical protein
MYFACLYIDLLALIRWEIDYIRGTMVSSSGIRKGAWTREEDILLRDCVEKYGEGRWHQVSSKAGI